MDLSTAIREGIKLHPHAVSGRYTAIRSGEPHAVCVMTAAWAGLGHRVSRMLDKGSGILMIGALMDTFPVLARMELCPDCVGLAYVARMPVAGLCMHLMDTHDRSREWIADWVETL